MRGQIRVIYSETLSTHGVSRLLCPVKTPRKYVPIGLRPISSSASTGTLSTSGQIHIQHAPNFLTVEMQTGTNMCTFMYLQIQIILPYLKFKYTR